MTFALKKKTSSRTIRSPRRRGAEGGIRTPARYYPPTPLAGEPLIATWVLLHGDKLRCLTVRLWERIRWRREWDSNPRLLRVTGFQDRLLKPLGHLSGASPNQRRLLSYHLLPRLSRAGANFLPRPEKNRRSGCCGGFRLSSTSCGSCGRPRTSCGA